MENLNSRRQFLTKLGIGALVATGAAALAACGKEGGGAASCGDPSGATKATRENVKYKDVSDDPAKKCEACQLYEAGEGGCGKCKLFNGTAVSPGGTCASWAKKA